MPPVFNVDELPPLFDPAHFSAESLISVRSHAVALLDSELLAIEEEFSIVDIVARCDEMLSGITGPILAREGETDP